MPVAIFLLQALLVTTLSLVFLFMPTVSSSYWILVALTAELYLIMYILMFISAIVLRYKAPDAKRHYKIPYKNIGIWTVSSLGILGSGFAIIIGLFPPTQLPTGSPLFYEIFLLGGIVFFCAIPFWIYRVRQNAGY